MPVALIEVLINSQLNVRLLAPQLPKVSDLINCKSGTDSYVAWFKNIGTSVSGCGHVWINFSLSFRVVVILSTHDHRLPLTSSNLTVRSRYRSDSETIILVFHGDQVHGDIDYRSQCSYWFIMIISMIYYSTNFQWNFPISWGYPGIRVPLLYVRATTDGFKPNMVGWVESKR